MKIRKNFVLKKRLIIMLVTGLLLTCTGMEALAAITPDQFIEKGKEFYHKGDFEHAASQWDQAISLLDADNDAGIYLDTIVHLANAYQSIGYHDRALAALNRALPVFEKSKDRRRNIIFLSTLGDINFCLGNMEDAVKYLLKGAEEAKEAKDPRAVATILNNVGNGLAADHDYDTAAGLYEECLELIADSEKDADLKITVLLNLARVEFQKEQYQQLSDIAPYLLDEIAALPDSFHKASNMITLSRLIWKLREKIDQPDKELTYIAYLALEEAKLIGGELDDPRIISDANGYMGQLYESEGRYQDAMRLTRRAIFFAQQGKFPKILYFWQWQLARLFRAEGDIENAINAYKEAVSTLTPIRQMLFRGFRSREDVFNEKVKPVYAGLAEMLLKQSETIQDNASRQKKLIEARDTMELLKTAELEDFFADECLIALKGQETSLERTPPHTAVLYPIPLSDSIAMLLTLPDGIKYISVPVGSEELAKTITQYRELLQTRPNNRFLHDAQQVYDWVIRPLEADLTAHEVDTLVVAPDGVLRLVPFSTFHDGEHFLVEKYAIGIIPAISLTDMKPFEKKDINILISGLSEGRQGFSPLPSVEAELRDIKKIMNGQVMIKNKDYTIDNLTQEFKNNPYSILHVATHGVFGGTPEQSFLLAYEDKLTMNHLENLIGLSRYRKQKVELLTLSACQTALGNERAALGLAGVAVKAGVKGAIATLWFVDDEATSLAIREFYRQLQTGITKAKAMQNVQKKLIAQRRYWHPLYWAPFLVIGNWM
ncbi:CHAT domain-containing protein [Desulfococcaceae bacterium HSG8]|nr:CHAT domain-containing protein [Desulfococcaceae bacterium HSG8]